MDTDRNVIRRWINLWRRDREYRATITRSQATIRNQRMALTQKDQGITRLRAVVKKQGWALSNARRRLWIEAERRYDSNQRQRARIDEMHRTLLDIFNHGDSYSSRRAAMALAIRRDGDSLIEQLRAEVSA